MIRRHKKKKSKKKKSNNNSKSKKRFVILFLLLFVVCLIPIIKYISNDYKIESMIISNEGLVMLNKYELPEYLYNEDSNGNTCISPYDVGDGVVTFGPGITYKDTNMGIDNINDLLKTNYSPKNQCILLTDLMELQKIKLEKYEDHVLQFNHDIRGTLTQKQFDALVFLAYNAPNLFSDEEFIKVMKDKNKSKDEYVKAIDKYYQTLATYDSFGEGWLKRANDSADLYFDGAYVN